MNWRIYTHICFSPCRALNCFTVFCPFLFYFLLHKTLYFWTDFLLGGEGLLEYEHFPPLQGMIIRLLVCLKITLVQYLQMQIRVRPIHAIWV